MKRSMNKLETYVWKDAKQTKDRNEVVEEYKLIDMEEYQLNVAYNHCKHMLYNNDVKQPGRMIVLDTVSKQIETCNTELALRWFKSLKDKDGNLLYTNDSLMTDIRSWIRDIPKEEVEKLELKDFVKVPPEFKHVNITLLQDACRDSLGMFDHSKISFAFLFRLGVYLTSKEMSEMDKFTEGNTLKEKFTVLKIQLGLQEDAPISANPKGLSEQEFRDMIHMKKMKGFHNCKYSELTTSQLETLKRKVLYAFEDQVTKQVKMWTTLMRQIEEVAEFKKFNLD